MNTLGPLRVLLSEEVSRIYDTSMKILSEVGIRFHNPKVVAFFKDLGLPVDAEDGVVRFPNDGMESCIASVPPRVLLHGRDKRRNVISQLDSGRLIPASILAVDLYLPLSVQVSPTFSPLLGQRNRGSGVRDCEGGGFFVHRFRTAARYDMPLFPGRRIDRSQRRNPFRFRLMPTGTSRRAGDLRKRLGEFRHAFFRRRDIPSRSGSDASRGRPACGLIQMSLSCHLAGRRRQHSGRADGMGINGDWMGGFLRRRRFYREFRYVQHRLDCKPGTACTGRGAHVVHAASFKGHFDQ